jgi:hypothetical protein
MNFKMVMDVYFKGIRESFKEKSFWNQMFVCLRQIPLQFVQKVRLILFSKVYIISFDNDKKLTIKYKEIY